MNLAEAVRSGNRLFLARLLTKLENDDPEGFEALDQLFANTGSAHLIGVTGSPGSGKSTLVNQLVQVFRKPQNGEEPQTVAIVAVDPTSPFSGGAILGDRIRMRDLSGDPGVFIRSMASRGAVGGLARKTAAVVQALDAAGFDIVIVETVGAGQTEVDIASLAQTTLVVESPGMGDDIQAIKAGILEIADILVVNKADRPGVDNTFRALRAMLDMANPQRMSRGHHALNHHTEATSEQLEENEIWQPPVIKVVAAEGVGIQEMTGLIRKHKEYLHQSGAWQDRECQRLQVELELLIQSNLMKNWRGGISETLYQHYLDELNCRRISPHKAAVELIERSTNFQP